MQSKSGDSTRLMWMLGLVLTLPMILVSGPLAGFFLGYALEKNLKVSPSVTPFLMVFGLLASGVQAYRLIQRIHSETKKREPERNG